MELAAVVVVVVVVVVVGVKVMAGVELAVIRRGCLADGNPASLCYCAGPRRSSYPDGSASAE